MGGEHEIQPALAHRVHERQHIAAWNTETAGNSIGLESRDYQISVVHASIITLRQRPLRLDC